MVCHMVFCCRISYLEIYNETMFDLLSTMNTPGSGTEGMVPQLSPMTVVEDENGCYVKGLSCHLAQNEEEALNLLFEVGTTLCLLTVAPICAMIINLFYVFLLCSGYKTLSL